MEKIKNRNLDFLYYGGAIICLTSLFLFCFSPQLNPLTGLELTSKELPTLYGYNIILGASFNIDNGIFIKVLTPSLGIIVAIIGVLIGLLLGYFKNKYLTTLGTISVFISSMLIIFTPYLIGYASNESLENLEFSKIYYHNSIYSYITFILLILSTFMLLFKTLLLYDEENIFFNYYDKYSLIARRLAKTLILISLPSTIFYLVASSSFIVAALISLIIISIILLLIGIITYIIFNILDLINIPLTESNE